MTDKREPERTAVPGGHESPSGAFKPQTGLQSKCRVFSAARSQRFRRAAAGRGLFSFGTKREPEKCQRFRRAGPTRKGLLAPFNPKEDGLHTKKLAASLNAFLCSAISRPLSRCGGSSPQGSGCALSVTFGDTLSPFLSLRDIFPRPGEVFQRERQEAFPSRSWLSLRESWREAPERARSPAGRDRRKIKIIFPLNIAQSEAEGILNPVFVVLKSQNPEKPAQKRLKAVQKRFWMCYTNK